MEATTTKTTQAGQAAFVPIPDLDKMAVGHAGLYPVDESDNSEEAVVVENNIPLGIKGGKTLIDCEKGIKAFVKDVLAKDRGNHLPNTETGVWVHYLTEGIARDFNRTWETPPISLREKQTSVEKAAAQGKRVLSKKEKNELLAKRSYEYWESDIKSGNITEDEADIFMKEARAKVRELEDAGYFLSPRKTEGVSMFDWRTEIKEKLNGDDSVLKIYNRHSIIPIVPCLESKLNKLVINKKVKKELDKSIVAGVPFSDGASFMEEKIEGWKKMKEHYEPRTFHIAKINQSGKMKDRWFVVDAIKKSTGAQVLLMWDQNGVDGMLE
jgi:hypothetical protein